MADQRSSELILERLRESAQRMARPAIRIGTIDRLVVACNAIESGEAGDLIKEVTGRTGRLRLNLEINPTNIEKYVKARGRRDQAWSGPTRVTIAKDENLLAFVQAREEERIKPFRPRRPTDKFRMIEDAISKLTTIEDRMLLRHEMESGRKAQRDLGLLRKGLRAIPGIDINHLLFGTPPSVLAAGSLPGSAVSIGDREILLRLFTRLTDQDELSRAGLEIENNRVRVIATKRALVKPDEIALLKRLARPAE